MKASSASHSPSSQDQDGEVETLREAGVPLPYLLGDQQHLSASFSSLRSPTIPILGQLLDVPPFLDRQTNVMTSTMVEGVGGDQMKVENISVIRTERSSSDSSLSSVLNGTPPPPKKSRLSRKRKLSNSIKTKPAKAGGSASVNDDVQDTITNSGQEKNATNEEYLDISKVSTDSSNKKSEDIDSSDPDNTTILLGTPQPVFNPMLKSLTSSTVETVLELSDCETVQSSNSAIVCQYPTISSDRVPITKEDYSTLARGTFLNDTMINFYLKYLHNEILAQSEQVNVHIFSTIFYMKLATDPVKGGKMDELEKNWNMSMVEKRHNRVKGWTKNFDLFNKNLVIIPICELSHWYMVVLVRPGGEQPCMMVLDSLGGDNTRAVDIIKEYLKIEGRVKLGKTALMNREEMKVVRPDIPQQRNGYDCGVFLLHYAEKLMERPDQFYTSTFGTLDLALLAAWFLTSEVDSKRSHMAKLVRQLAFEQAQGRTVTFPDLIFTSENNDVEVKHRPRADIDHDDDQDPLATPPQSPFQETPSHSPNISFIIQKEIACLSPVHPTTHRTRDRLSSQAPLFSSPPKFLDNSSEPATSAVLKGPERRKERMQSKKSNLVQPRMVLFTAQEFYKGKPWSERLFDEFLEDEAGESEKLDDMFSQLDED